MKKIIVFDLDDTLYKEIDFLKSAYREIVEYALKCTSSFDLKFAELYEGMLDAYFSEKDAFNYLITSVGGSLDKAYLLSLYRNHVPHIILSEGSFDLLCEIKSREFEIGIITDGRSVQQRNKIHSLGLDNIVKNQNIIISEEFGLSKPSRANFEYFIKMYPYISEFYYIADNPNKDFLAPNKLGWKTVCLLDDGRNIHKQKMDLPEEYLPQVLVRSLIEVIDIL